jgi:Cu+-exporting ATPase
VRASTSAPTVDKAACYHCGLDCPDDTITWQDKAFCCHGCKAVFLLLSENGLADYYRDLPGPGSRPATDDLESRFAFLDNSTIADDLVDYTDGQTSRWRVRLPDIHCASCVWLLENLYRIHPGVQVSRVDFVRKELTVVLDVEKLSVRGLAELLARIGYEPELRADRGSSVVEQARRRALYQKVGVAGFCFGNVMLFYLAEYLSVGGVREALLHRVFVYASGVLSIPVLFYAARDYLGSALTALKHRTLNIDVPIALGMVALFIQSWYEVLSGSGQGYFDSLCGLTFFLLIGRVFQQKTYDRLSFDRDYRSYFPLSAQRVVADQIEVVPIGALEAGDRIVVRHQEIIPADAVLVSGEGLIDYSFVTGESEPRVVATGERLFAGGRQVGTVIEVGISKTVSESQLVSLWSDSGHGPSPRPRSEALADRVAHYFTAAVLLIAAAAAGYWIAVGGGVAIYAFTSVLIVACPCALALSGPFALGTALRYLGRAGLFLRNTAVVERMAGIDTIVFDKTGTLAYTEERHVEFDGQPLNDHERSWVTSLTRHSSHPVSRVLARYCGGPPLPISGFEESVGEGVACSVAGHSVRLGRRAWVEGAKRRQEPPDSLRQGTWLAIDDRLRGVFRVRDRLREGLNRQIGPLASQFELAVMTGDSDRERSRLAALFGSSTRLEFDQSPQDKRRAIAQMRTQGKRVLMAGDGLNDAGALRAADVGIAVSESTAAFTPASDGILDSNQLPLLGRMLDLTRRSQHVIWICYLLSFAYNAIGLRFAVTGQLSPVIAAILMPLSSITVVALATFLTVLAARRAGVG